MDIVSRCFAWLCLTAALLDGTSCTKMMSETAPMSNPANDWAPVNIAISVRDSEGHDLLDPARTGNYFQGATLTYRGTTYTARLESEVVGTRYYSANIYGYYLVRQEEYLLIFGEIDGSRDMDEDLVLKWPDGSSDILHYHCSEHDEQTITCQRSWLLNGVEASVPFVLIK